MAEVKKVLVSQDALYFPMPITANIENLVELKNQEDAVVIFKIKTSSPDRYVVKPKVGILHPHTSQKVRFICLAVAAAGAATAKDRFSIELRFVTADDSLDEQVSCWGRKANGNAIVPPVHRVTMNCHYLAPGEAAPAGIKTYLDKGRAASSTPSQGGAAMATPRGNEGTAGLASSPSTDGLPQSVSGEFVPPPIHHRAPTNQFTGAATKAVAGAAGGATATVTAATPTIGDTAQSALAQARAAAKQLPNGAAGLQQQGAPVVQPLRGLPGAISGLTPVSNPLSPGASSNASNHTTVDYGADSTTTPKAPERGGAGSSIGTSIGSSSSSTSAVVSRHRMSGLDRAVSCSLPIWIVVPLMVVSLYVGLRGEEAAHLLEAVYDAMQRILFTPLMQV